MPLRDKCTQMLTVKLIVLLLLGAAKKLISATRQALGGVLLSYPINAHVAMISDMDHLALQESNYEKFIRFNSRSISGMRLGL